MLLVELLIHPGERRLIIEQRILVEQRRPQSGTLNGSGSTFQLVYQQTAISSFKSVQSGMTVNYGGGGSGKGRTDLASGVVNFAGSDSPIPAKETGELQGQDGALLPRS